jgi:hypothetical protein
VVTAFFDLAALNASLLGSPAIKVLRIEDFPFPANPMTTTDFLKLAVLLSMIDADLLFLNNIIEFLNYRVLIINR